MLLQCDSYHKSGVMHNVHLNLAAEGPDTRTQLSGWTGSTNSHNLGANIVYFLPATSTNNMSLKRKYLSKFPWCIDEYKTFYCNFPCS